MKTHAKPALILALLGALIALAKEVVVDYDHSAEFANYKTYSRIRVKVGDPSGWSVSREPSTPNLSQRAGPRRMPTAMLG